MARSRPLQPLDVVTGIVSGALAAGFFTLAAVAAVSSEEPAPVLDTAVSSVTDR